MADRRPIGRIHPAGVPIQQHPLAGLWASLPPELVVFATDVAEALASNAETSQKLRRILVAVPRSDILSCILRLLHRRFLPIIAAYSAPWSFTSGLGVGLLISNWSNPAQCTIRKLKDNYAMWLNQDTESRSSSYLKHILFKLVRYAAAPALLYGLPRFFSPALHSEHLHLLPLVTASIAAFGFGIQSGSDLTAELRAPGDSMLITIFQQLETQVDMQNARRWLHTASSAFATYGVLSTLYHYALRGMRATLPFGRISTAQIQQYKQDSFRLGWTYFGLGLYTIWRAYLYT